MREAPVARDHRSAARRRARRCVPTTRSPRREAQRIYGEPRRTSRSRKNAYEAAEGADALCIVTEWQEFRSPDFDRLKQILKAPRHFRRPQSLRPAHGQPLRLHLLRHRPRQAACAELSTWQVRMMLTPVILSGGAGTRLWPLSRELYPKQLLRADRRAHHAAADRAAPARARLPAAPVVVCNEAHRFLVAEQLRQLQHGAARHRAGALRPQHGPGDRAGGARGAEGRSGEPDARTRCCWCCPPITSSATSPAFQQAVRTALAGGASRASW